MKEQRNNNKKSHRINCNTCRALVSLFFSSGMTNTVRQAIISHLTKCNNCLDRYDTYEKAHKDTLPNIKVKELILELRSNLDDVDNSLSALEIISSSTFDSNTDKSHFNPTKWYDAASNYDIEMLMNLKVFRDLIGSYELGVQDKDLDYSEFYKYITQKMAKRIDMLEASYLKESIVTSS